MFRPSAKYHPRTPESCPYREAQASREDGEESAVCGLLREITGVQDMSLLAASRRACETCCRKATPSPENLNPVVASLLYILTEKVLERDGVSGCDVNRARQFRQRAANNLDVIGPPKTFVAYSTEVYAGPCFYLGEQIGDRDCPACRGRVRLKVFECRHEMHPNTTIHECRQCPDYDRSLDLTNVSTWAVGVTTAPRKSSTLKRSLASLGAAGWKEPFVFAEPRGRVPLSIPCKRLIRRTEILGAWPNWYLALSELYQRHPRADAFLLAQDDVLYCRGLREYLEETLWPMPRLGVVSLHTAGHQDRGDVAGFFPADHGWGAWGAQAYVFPNASVRALLRNSRVLNHRHRGPSEGKYNVDSVIGHWCRETGLDYVLHAPSLTQHIGEASSLWSGKCDTDGRRRAASFPGEEVDIREKMNALAVSTAKEPFGLTTEACSRDDAIEAPRKPWLEVTLAIVTVLIGRRKPLDDWKNWLLTAEIPGRTSLYIVDNSADREFGALVQAAVGEFIAARRFAGTSLIFGPGPAPEGLGRQSAERFANIAFAFNLGLTRTREDYVFLMDDDTIPPRDGVAKLGACLVEGPEDSAMASGCYESALFPGCLVASRATASWKDRPTVGELHEEEVIQVGFAGTGSALIKGEALDEILPIPTRFVAQPTPIDHYVCNELRGRGYTIWLHGGVQCAHLFA